ncbi:hypothetical protein D1831_04470 [Lactiplantibacillus garii]|uniref:Uncharacterized protein n=1 Tax=Lactiplantibacillus garii TaxID=2306423 RepID=A0A3R8J864_9LACO|nr:hypothetical protein D1831_04470 [Lactiplantibacillus garii]
MKWRDRQHKHVWQWLVVLATGLLMWVETGLSGLADTVDTRSGLEDVRWVWRDKSFNLVTLVVITVVVVLGLVLVANVQRLHHS